MTRKHHKRFVAGEHFAVLPDEVLVSAALVTLPHYCNVLLTAIAAQYRGTNGGDLAMTGKIAKRYGIKSRKQLNTGLKLLLEHGLIQKTKQGGKRPLGPCLYALTWRPIDACAGKLDIGPTMTASNAWAKWLPTPPAGQNEINQQHPRGTRSAPPRDQSALVSTPPRDQSKSINGTPEGAPSRVSPEGACSDGTNGAHSTHSAGVLQ